MLLLCEFDLQDKRNWAFTFKEIAEVHYLECTALWWLKDSIFSVYPEAA